MASAQPVRSPGPQEMGERRGQPVTRPGVQHNIGEIAALMRTIHQLLHLGPLTPKQATAVTEMMTRLGAMMQEMSRPHSEQLDRQHELELKEMRRRVESIKDRLKSQ
jgi:hypothetical protein